MDAAAPTLSILICSLESRAAMRAALLASLQPQLTPAVELLTEIDRGQATIGAKRNRLLERATGEYVCFIDDDDQIHPEYVPLILAALESRPDCVGFHLRYYHNGEHRGDACHSLRFDKYAQQRVTRKITNYERTPNHLNPIRREIAAQVRFPEISRSEDSDFAVRVRPLLTTEVFVDEILYHYYYLTAK